MNLAPIVIFVYNRLNYLQNTINSLKSNYLAPESELFVFSDGPRNAEHKEAVLQIRNYLSTVSGFKSITVISREKNYGLGINIIEGTTQIIKQYGKVIVLEDDLLIAPNYLNYINQCLNYYENEKSVFSVTGYTYNLKIRKDYEYDNYFTPRCESLGWGTWSDRWELVDWKLKSFAEFINNKKEVKAFEQGGDDLPDMMINFMRGKYDSWAIKWCYSHFINNAVCSYPVISKIQHIGETGVHVKSKLEFLDTPLDNTGKTDFNLNDNITSDHEIIKSFRKIFKRNFIRKMKRKFIIKFPKYFFPNKAEKQ
jgi:GT2 family glycosyltransferase